jgi:Putative amidase domain
MKLNKSILLGICISIIFSFELNFVSHAGCQNYNRGAALNYASQYWGPTKWEYNWIGIGGQYNAYENDCTNFVSQCLVAAGLVDNFVDSMCSSVGFPSGCVDNFGMIIRVKPLSAILKVYFCAEITGPFKINNPDDTIIPDNLKEGDLVVMGKSTIGGDYPMTHAAIVVNKGNRTFGTVTLAYHSNNEWNIS